MKTKIIILSIIVGALAIYNLPYFEEKRAFDKVKESNDISMCDWYELEYPQGSHLEEVVYMKIGFSDYAMANVGEYLTRFPNGEHVAEVTAIYDKLWDQEMAKYVERDKSNESKEAVAYMTEMLQYMKQNHINTIVVDVNSTLKLKEYSEYDYDVRKVLEDTNGESLPIAANMIPLKANFSTADQNILMNILIDGVQKSINKMFTPDFIKVVSGNSELAMGEKANKSPLLNFDYTITSQEDKVYGYTIPHIWTYHEMNIPKNYLIGISIKFNAHFSIPGSTTTFSFSDKGEPSDNINNIEDIKDGYRRMTQICFAEFSNKMSTNMGLAEAYFQGDEEQSEDIEVLPEED